MKRALRILLAWKALRQLGPGSLGLYALYQFGLRTGHYRRVLAASLAGLEKLSHGPHLKLHPCIPDLPVRESLLARLGDQIDKLYQQADEIVAGNVRLFGGEPVPLVLTPPSPLLDWTPYGSDQVGGQDIKFVWEPARFGWACTLAMAYYLSGDEKYAQSFWSNTELFLSANPAYMGPHWTSAQEVAIRIVALAFAFQVFSRSKLTTPQRLESLANAIAIHAERIPPTMVYARSQNNNHLVTEALGLYTASALLADHPLAAGWHRLGWKWLQNAFQAQIDPDGTYIQHSTNYHRLMLQAAIWAVAVQRHSYKDEILPSKAFVNLVHSTGWLLLMLDPQTGRVPNLGHNDGAYILPLTVCPWHDYRPVIHAAARLFWQVNLLPQGPWHDMSCWLGLSDQPIKGEQSIGSYQKSYQMEIARHKIPIDSPYVLVNQVNSSWAKLRAARFHSRPAHADQLHFDLWWHGINLAMDAGTYLYNAPLPWKNSLTSALVHNTVTIDGKEFMLRAGRFLYLDWAQAKALASHYDPESSSHSLTVSHDGYRKLGITHARTMTTYQDGHWEVEDCLDGPSGQAHTVRLHWLLPDWEYEINDVSRDEGFLGVGIILRSPRCKFTLRAGVMQPHTDMQKPAWLDFQLARAGTLIYGSGEVLPIAGYVSPTYGVKIPALAFILNVTTTLPIELKSLWTLPRARAAVIIIKNDKIALLERKRAGRHYYVIPGGKQEPGETLQMAAAREAKEELGLEVKIGRMVAVNWYQGRAQYYFLAEETGGMFGQMSGPEKDSLPASLKGSYRPTWVAVSELPNLPVLPDIIANLVWKSHPSGWPEEPVVVSESPAGEPG